MTMNRQQHPDEEAFVSPTGERPLVPRPAGQGEDGAGEGQFAERHDHLLRFQTLHLLAHEQIEQGEIRQRNETGLKTPARDGPSRD